MLQIPIPVLSEEEQQQISDARELALKRIEIAKKRIVTTADEVEALISGTKKIEVLEEII